MYHCLTPLLAQETRCPNLVLYIYWNNQPEDTAANPAANMNELQEQCKYCI